MFVTSCVKKFKLTCVPNSNYVGQYEHMFKDAINSCCINQMQLLISIQLRFLVCTDALLWLLVEPNIHFSSVRWLLKKVLCSPYGVNAIIAGFNALVEKLTCCCWNIGNNIVYDMLLDCLNFC